MAAGKKTGRKSQASNDFLEPRAPESVSATNVGSGRAYNNGRADVTFSLPANSPAATSYTVTSSPGSFTGTGSSSPISVTGLQSDTAYTFTVVATNAVGNSPASSASSSITATTVPATPNAPTATAQGSAANDDVSWSAPATGGSAITSYTWASSDGKGATQAGTSVTVTQEAGTAQTYNVYATNANGNSGTSSASGSITSFSFTPFGFAPFGAFGFTPFGAFGFTPFGAFGFTPFGAFGFFQFGFAPSQCVHEDTLIKTPNGLIPAKYINVGDTIYTLDISEINSEDSLSFNSESLISTGLIETEIQNIDPSQKDTIVWFNGDDSAKFSQEQPMFVKRDGQYGILPSGLVDTNDILIKVSPEGEIVETPVTEVNTQEGTFNVYSFSTGPKPWYIAGDYLVHIK
jgi:chitodextrinase